MIDRETKVAPLWDNASAGLNRKLTQWSLLIIAGQLTGDDLRRSLDDPLVSKLVSSGGFRDAMEKACEEINPGVTQDASILLEIVAAERKLARLLVERSYRQG